MTTIDSTAPAIPPSLQDLIVSTLKSVDVSSLAEYRFNELHSVLKAIVELSAGNEIVIGLASVGVGLAESAADEFFSENFECCEKLEALKNLKEVGYA